MKLVFDPHIKLMLDPRVKCKDCYPAYFYLRFKASLKELDGRQIEGFSLLKVDLPQLVAKINGPNEARKGVGDIALNASESHDPDKLAGGVLNFTWFCKHKRDDMYLKGACDYGKSASNGKILVVNVNRLKSKHSYDFKVVVSKEGRTKTATHAVKVHPSVHFNFR